MWFLSRIFRHQELPDNRSDTAQEAIEASQAARKSMGDYVRLRRKEVAGVRLEQMELRRSINILEQTILADRLRKEHDDVLE